MIQNFSDDEAEAIFHGLRSRRLPGDIQRTAKRKLMMLDAAVVPEELRSPPGNHFEALSGRTGYYSIRINDQWRITFAWKHGATNVKIEDYH